MTATPETPPGGARERIVRTAYGLFARYGVLPVGIDRIVADAGVAKTTLYHHFHSKEELVVATLELREHLWTHDWLESEVARRGGTAEEQLLSVFDAFEDWFHRQDYEGCLFVNTLLETNHVPSAAGAASLEGLADVRVLLHRLVEAAGIPDPDDFVREWQLLMFGAIVAALAGDADAARRARRLGQLRLALER